MIAFLLALPLALRPTLPIWPDLWRPRVEAGAPATQVPPAAPARDSCATWDGALQANAWIARGRESLGMNLPPGQLLHFRADEARYLRDQSDRPGPPYIAAITSSEHWVDPWSGAERTAGPGATVILSGPTAAWTDPDSAAAPSADTFVRAAPSRALDPWSVLVDWSRAPDAHVVGQCRVRDAWRITLGRAGPLGEDRLYLDEGTGIPVALDRREFNYFRGPEAVRYVYATWWHAGSAMYPISATRVVDGFVESSRSVFPGRADLVSSGSAPRLLLPDSTLRLSPAPHEHFDTLPPDTVRVAGDTYLLVSRAFTEAVTLGRDTVFLLDAAAGEIRARQDSAWIARLYPGRHPVTVIFASIAWPHMAGVRYWTARGATVVAHAMADSLLTDAVARDWSAWPDELERTRPRPTLRFTGVTDSTSFAAGAVKVYPLTGITGDGGLLVWIPSAQFVWASDRVQVVKPLGTYEADVWRTAATDGLSPRWTSGPHFRLLPWSVGATARSP